MGERSNAICAEALWVHPWSETLSPEHPAVTEAGPVVGEQFFREEYTLNYTIGQTRHSSSITCERCGVLIVQVHFGWLPAQCVLSFRKLQETIRGADRWNNNGRGECCYFIGCTVRNSIDRIEWYFIFFLCFFFMHFLLELNGLQAKCC